MIRVLFAINAVFCGFAVAYLVDADVADLGCVKNESVTTKFALPIQFFDNYKFKLQIRDLVGLTTDYASGVSLNGGKNSAIQLHRVSDPSLQESKNRTIFYNFAINETGYGQYITNKTYCSMVNFAGSWVSTNPFEQPQIVLNITSTNQTWKTINDIYNWANSSAQWSWHDVVATSNDTSLPGLASHELWSGCLKKNSTSANAQSYIEMRIAYLPSDSKTQYPSTPTGSIFPLYVRIIVYDVTDDNKTIVRNDLTYDVAEYSPIENPSEEKAFTVPSPGVYCKESLVTSPPTVPNLSTSFTAQLEYTDVNKKMIFTEQITYSGTNRQLFAFTYHKNEAEIGFVGDLGLKDFTHGFVLHDFDYGIQYVLDRDRSTCLSVTPLPGTAGDVMTSGKTLKLLSPIELLLRAQAANYTYAGEMSLPAYASVNTFKNSQTDSKGITTVREATFNVPEGNQTALLLDLNVYTWDKVALGETHKTAKMHFYNQQPINGGLQWQQLDVGACAKIAETSYFMIEIDNFDGAALTVKGLTAIKEAVIDQLAAHANISALRLPMSQVYMKNVSTASSPNKANLLFEIAEPSGVQPANGGYEVEISVASAVANLNETLQSGDIDVKLSDKVTLKVQKESLQLIPTDFTPPLPPPTPPAPTPEGHGGSMAALGICMLIVGAVFGVVGGWWMWKRNRGIAYQIYE